MLNYLSPELIELVLIHLDIFSLKSCLEASSSFRDVIIHSPDIMKKLTLRLNEKNWKSKVPFIKEYGKYVRNVEIECSNGSCIYFRLLHFMPKTIKLKLNLMNSQRLHKQRSVDNEQDDIIIAQLMSLLECEDEIFGELNLTKLENLEAFFYKIDPAVIFHELRNCKNLKKFCFRSSVETQIHHESLISFLCQQNDLLCLELKVGQMDIIFSAETIDKMNFKLNTLRIVPSFYAECDYTYLNKFLLKQSECLEELRVFSWSCEAEIADGISKLKNLKSLTTHGLLPYFNIQKPQSPTEEDKELVVLKNLTYFRYYRGNKNQNFDEFDTTSLPGLKCLNVHFGIDHRLFGCYPDIKVTANPLRNLRHLKEFHIESCNQDLLHYLSSPNLESLVITYEDVLFDIASWTQIAKNLPKLQSLTIVNVNYEKFLKFIVENHERFIQKIRGLKSLELLLPSNDVLKLFISSGKVTNVVGNYCLTNSPLMKKKELLERKFDKIDFVMISQEEYDDKYERLQFYFHPCGP
ncbi:unnamed protein product [Chironomus riparius]|uniref:F-box domain-containing protein n=1 Tax=Chironomus riparius TaxID=315576 RepID=A0A9N9SBC4_9DIPT|nr:unnamed protein product [Chironomus riparius]